MGYLLFQNITIRKMTIYYCLGVHGIMLWLGEFILPMRPTKSNYKTKTPIFEGPSLKFIDTTPRYFKYLSDKT